MFNPEPEATAGAACDFVCDVTGALFNAKEAKTVKTQSSRREARNVSAFLPPLCDFASFARFALNGTTLTRPRSGKSSLRLRLRVKRVRDSLHRIRVNRIAPSSATSVWIGI